MTLLGSIGDAGRKSHCPVRFPYDETNHRGEGLLKGIRDAPCADPCRAV